MYYENFGEIPEKIGVKEVLMSLVGGGVAVVLLYVGIWGMYLAFGY